ncbi:MAG TPA: alpha-amylase family glycosyl hydrolase, partial [Bacillota bacterium]|nr:alpha-amylase family glycosyl hydrolase [Bacillota bacterium]
MRRRLTVAVFMISVLLLILSPLASAVEPIGPTDLIYFIMTDRFNDAAPNEYYANKKDASGYHGGDLQGIIEKLDYINSLGFTAIWITPVVDNQPGGYHGYWAIDFYKMEEHLGNLDDLKRLVEEAH